VTDSVIVAIVLGVGLRTRRGSFLRGEATSPSLA